MLHLASRYRVKLDGARFEKEQQALTHLKSLNGKQTEDLSKDRKRATQNRLKERFGLYKATQTSIQDVSSFDFVSTNRPQLHECFLFFFVSANRMNHEGIVKSFCICRLRTRLSCLRM